LQEPFLLVKGLFSSWGKKPKTPLLEEVSLPCTVSAAVLKYSPPGEGCGARGCIPAFHPGLKGKQREEGRGEALDVLL
jgi:hypothetical protein